MSAIEVPGAVQAAAGLAGAQFRFARASRA